MGWIEEDYRGERICNVKSANAALIAFAVEATAQNAKSPAIVTQRPMLLR